LDVNAIFRKVRAYDEALRAAEASGTFPSTASGGAATGWAVILGAAYKTKTGALYGLADVAAGVFLDAVLAAHAECGGGRAAVPLPEILDRVCRSLRYSPVRFEAALNSAFQDGSLSSYETQRATVNRDLPEHDVLVSPIFSDGGHFRRHLAPGRGIVIGGSLVSSLVRRSGDS
jgi:hypothetical protein